MSLFLAKEGEAPARGIAFVSTGPKSYSIKIALGDEVKYITKAKGVTLNKSNSEIVNFTRMVELVHSPDEAVQVPTRQLKAGAFGGISEKEGSKIFRRTFDKRKLIDDNSYKTLPWGYRN